MKKFTIKKAFVLVFALLFLLPLAFFRFGHDIESTADNAMLPELSEGARLVDYTEYFRKRLGLRDLAVDGYIDLSDRLFGQLEHPLYCWGQDGYCYLKVKSNAVDESFLDAFCRYLRQVQDFCEQRGTDFMYCLNPSKSTVYPEHLPKGYIYSDRWLNTLYEKLDAYGVHYVSNAEVLRERAATEQVYNKKFDAAHWNDFGAFYGTNNILQAMAQDWPAIRPLELSDFDIGTTTARSLLVSNFRINEEIPAFSPLHTDRVNDRTAAYDDLRFYGSYNEHAYYETIGADESLPRVLFFHGSYYNGWREMYSSSFRSVAAIHNYQNILDFVYYYNIFQPEYVLIESVEFATSIVNFDYYRMQSVVLPAPLAQQDMSSARVLDMAEFDSHSAEYGLSNFTREQAEGSDLVTLSFDLAQSYSQIYLCASGCEYVMECGDGSASVTIDASRADLRDATLYLFA